MSFLHEEHAREAADTLMLAYYGGTYSKVGGGRRWGWGWCRVRWNGARCALLSWGSCAATSNSQMAGGRPVGCVSCSRPAPAWVGPRRPAQLLPHGLVGTHR